MTEAVRPGVANSSESAAETSSSSGSIRPNDLQGPQTHSVLAAPAEATSKTVKRPRAKPRIVLEGSPEEILARNNRAASPAFVDKLLARAGTHWNKFYTNHANATPFFKDRHWTDREWPQLAQLAEVNEDQSGIADDPTGGDEAERRRLAKGKGKAVLEVGCGTGAFIYPLLERYPQARYVAFDFAKKAVELTKNHPHYDPSKCHIFQHDLTLPLSALSEKLAAVPPGFGEPVQAGEFDVVSCIFVLSALSPKQHMEALKTLISLLAPGGWLLFRDYAWHDAAQLRFHSLPSASYATEPSLLSPRTSSVTSDSSTAAATEKADPPSVDPDLPFYRRGDNTLTYFFSSDEIARHVSDATAAMNGSCHSDYPPIELEGGVEIVEREMENRKEGWGCTRRFVHGSWRRRQ